MNLCPLHPLKQLSALKNYYKRDFRLATLYSLLNKFFDVLPEVLIGVAVDIVVNGEKLSRQTRWAASALRKPGTSWCFSVWSMRLYGWVNPGLNIYCR
jgi:methylaspartate ammonia-lyase